MADLSQLPHGGALDLVRAAFPDAPEPWLDLSTGVNPHSYPVGGLAPEWLAHLPTQAQFTACRIAMAEAWGVDAAHVWPIPGSELVIRHLPRLLAGERVSLAEFTYGDHQRAWSQAGRTLLHHDDPLMLAGQVDILVLVNPNNPTGRLYERDRVIEALERQRENGGTLIMDEAYMDLTPEHSLSDLAGRSGFVILRSTGKFYGLAGLRLGALLGEAKLIDWWRELSGHWSVATPALELGTRIYRERSWPNEMRTRLREEAKRFQAMLLDCGFEIVGSTDLFALVRVVDAAALWRHLAANGIYVRAWPDRNYLLRIGLPLNEMALARLQQALSSYRP